MDKVNSLKLSMITKKPSVVTKKPILKWVARSEFGKIYFVLSVVILLVTTLFWSILGATLHRMNADQIVDPYLFKDWSTFHAATFPGAHTFLLKWPLFALVSLFGVSSTSLAVATVAVVLVTVGALAVLMYRIERRPLVIGTLYLALAAVLLLVPTQPYAGGILPVNMAMLATRNVEYVVYGLSLMLLVRSRSFKSWKFISAVVVLGLLIASDKLFLSLSIGGAFLALVTYAVMQNWRLVSMSVRWLIASGLAGIFATALLAIINISGLTHIAGESGANPYSFVQDTKNAVVGVTYAGLGLLTNFGANPAFDATQIPTIPLTAGRRLLTFSGLAYVLNLVILIGGLFAVVKISLASFHTKKPKLLSVDSYYFLALALIWSTVAAVAVFVVTSHYYAVDARYLAISLFAAFVAMAVVTRKRKWRPEFLTAVGLVLLVAVLFGITGALAEYQKNEAALQSVVDRNQVVAQILSRRHVDTLMGDYWRVVPIKLASHNRQNVTPLADCIHARQGLSTAAWQPDLRRHSFAYLVSLDKGLTDFPACSLAQVTAAYGSPSSTVLISGDVSSPKELLLFYDHGQRLSSKGHIPDVFSTIAPVETRDLRNTSCEGPTTLSIVAHQDDDLLFMNPDIQHEVDEGHCVRTVYLTAGDGGHDKFYWLSREQGSEAAYDTMIGAKRGWLQQTVQLPGKQYITVASPAANPNISLVFLHLPDGNLTGEGFKVSHYESLKNLIDNPDARMHTVDGQSSYDGGQLVSALQSIMQVYQPSLIRTQATYASETFPDHSDHIATSQLAQKAYESYERSHYDNSVIIPFARYIGYPVRENPENVTDSDLEKKSAAFFAYARFDGAVCFSMRDCSATQTYSEYLTRQYMQE